MLPEKLCSIRTFEDQNTAQCEKIKDEEPHLENDDHGKESKSTVEHEDKSGSKPSKKRKLEGEDGIEVDKEHKIKKEKKTSDVDLSHGNQGDQVENSKAVDKQIINNGSESEGNDGKNIRLQIV